MPQVLVFGEYGSLNGGENSFLANVPVLKEQGWTVSAAVPNPSDFSSALDRAGVTVYPFWLTGLGGDRLSQEQIRSAMANIISETQPDLVHANSLSTSRLLGPVGQQLAIPCSGHLRDIIKCSAKAISDINCLDRIIAVSQATANHHASFGMDESKLRVVHNGVDLQRFAPPEKRARFATEPSPIRTELGLPSDSFLALCIGQIGMRKGIEQVFDAMEQPISQYSNVHLLMVGERHSTKQEAIDYEQNCLARAKQISPAQIHWLGRRTDIESMMQQVDLLVHMPKQEPLGRVLLEAAASGLPMVTTDVGGTREILAGLEQLIISTRDCYRNCFEFDKFFSDESFHAYISQQLRQIAEARFVDQKAGQNLAAQWLEVLDLHQVDPHTKPKADESDH